MKIKYPVNYIAITQGYHQGYSIDFGWNNSHGGKNQPIYSVADGIVYMIQKQKKGGNVLYIKHTNGYVSEYAHLEKIIVKKGEKVSYGQQVATMGNTGSASTGNHLHFSLYKTTSIKNSNKLKCLEYMYVTDEQYVGEKTAKNYTILKENDRPKETIKYVYNCDSLNVREGVGTNTKLINNLIAGTEVRVLEEKSGWVRIGEKQWVSGNYLTEKEPKTIYKTKVVSDADGGLNVRTSNKFTGSSNVAKSMTPLKNGTIVSVIKISGNGVQIGEKRWVYEYYLD